jgi:hypothetical protein
MGAALTYARRYALFTLVGIAGEDDLDAPDLIVTPTIPPSAPEKLRQPTIGRSNGSRPGPRGPARRRDDTKADSAAPIRSPEASAELRARLLTELNILASADDAAHWAHRRLRAKNELMVADAEQVETAFRAKLATLGRRDALPEASTSQNSAKSGTGIDKSVLAVPEPRRIRDRDHVRSVASSLVSFAVGSRQTPTTYDSRKCGRSGAKPAMNSPFHYVGGTIARCTVAAMRPHGGSGQASIR